MYDYFLYEQNIETRKQRSFFCRFFSGGADDFSNKVAFKVRLTPYKADIKRHTEHFPIPSTSTFITRSFIVVEFVFKSTSKSHFSPVQNDEANFTHCQ